MANFEAFRWNISSSINLLFLKSAAVYAIYYILYGFPKLQFLRILAHCTLYKNRCTFLAFLWGRRQVYLLGIFGDVSVHSSKIRGLCLMKCSSEMLQNLPYFWNTKTHVVFFIFHFVLLYFFLQ